MEGNTGPVDQKSKNKPLVFIDVNVVPMDNDRVLRGHDVVVKEGRIAAIGKTARLDIPEGSFRIDGRDKFLMPGLADMHTHTWGEADLLLFLVNGVTTIRNMWGSHRQLTWRTKIAKCEMLGPTIFTAGPLIDGSPPIWNSSKVIVTREEAEEEIAREKVLGYDFVKVYNRLSPEAYYAIVGAAKRRGLKVAGHIPYEVGLGAALEAGQDSIEHLEGYLLAIQSDDSPLRKGKPLDLVTRRKLVDFIDERKIPGIVASTLNSKVWNCVTLVVTQKFVSTDDAKKLLDDPRMRLVPPEWLAMWDPLKDFRLKTLTAEDFQRARKADAIKSVITGKLHKAGCKILLGTDTPNPFVIPGYSIHEELRNLVNAGLSPYDAIRAWTADAAEFLGASNEFGTIQVGRRADLILLERNPFEDVTAISNPLGVMAAGRWFSRSELEWMLEKQVSTYLTREDRLDALFRTSPGEVHTNYLVKSSNTLLGKERIYLEEVGGALTHIDSQVLLNAPPRVNSFLLSLRLDRDGTAGSLSFEGNTSEGKSLVNMVVEEGGLVKITVSQGDEPVLETEMHEPPGVVLASPHIASYIPLLKRLRIIEVGQTLSINMLRLESEPELDFVDAKLEFVRKPDIEADVEEDDDNDGSRSGIASFGWIENRKNATFTGTLLLDRLAILRIFEREEQMGRTRFELVGDA